jgi:hypothetical protein
MPLSQSSTLTGHNTPAVRFILLIIFKRPEWLMNNQPDTEVSRDYIDQTTECINHNTNKSPMGACLLRSQTWETLLDVCVCVSWSVCVDGGENYSDRSMCTYHRRGIGDESPVDSGGLIRGCLIESWAIQIDRRRASPQQQQPALLCLLPPPRNKTHNRFWAN